VVTKSGLVLYTATSGSGQGPQQRQGYWTSTSEVSKETGQVYVALGIGQDLVTDPIAIRAPSRGGESPGKGGWPT